jgi:hypothetical protein
MTNSSSSKSIWLLEYITLLVGYIFTISTLCISVAVNNSFNPLSWCVRSTFVASVILLMSIWMTLAYLEQQKKLSIEKFVHMLFNFDEYINPAKKPLDAILTHYTNVATIGLFLAISIYSIRPLLDWSPPLAGLVLAICTVSAFVIYALFLLRLARRFVEFKNVFFYVFILIAIFIVDSKAVEMLIKSTPSS